MTNEQGRLAWLIKRGLDWLGRGRLAKTSGQQVLPGLISQVEVIRDRWGVPHITAENEPDLFFAQGFVHAQDRLWQMEFQRRLVAGRLAEIFGDLGVSADRWMRTLGMRQVAEAEARLISNADGAILEAYCAGVNAFLAAQRLPVEFRLLRYIPEPWSPADSLSWSKMLAWTLSSNWECELLRRELIEKLGPALAAQLELDAGESWPLVMDIPDSLQFDRHLARIARAWTGPGAPEGVGSNNWVVAGRRSATGKPILANDMHLLLSLPAIWYENHLVSGDYNVTGVSLPGLPLIISGHNGRVAWGFTAGYADVQDLYEEHLRQTPEGDLEYEYQGSWHPAEVRREAICVRGSGAKECHTIFHEVVHTRHGPVITPLVDSASTPLALKWTAHETSGGTFHAMVGMNRARNSLELHEAMRTWNGPTLNVVYADVEGNIGYTYAGKVPVRAQGDGSVPAPGWTGTHEWTGFIPYDQLPHLYNPESGYIATANNRVVGQDYPYWLGLDFISGDRAERIVELILEREKVDTAYFQKMQSDQRSPSARALARILGQLDVDPDLQPAVDLLRGWDGILAADSPAAAVYEVLVLRLLRLLLEKRLGDLMPRFTGKILHEVAASGVWGHHAREWLRLQLLKPGSAWFDLGRGETREDILRLALRGAVDLLTAEQGPQMENWGWGRLHTVTFAHLLGRQKPLDVVFNRGPYPVGGDGQTIWATVGMMDRLESSEGMVGPPFRFIADLSDLSQSLGVLAPGQSGQPGSPHYDDQIEDWFNGGYHPMLYRRDDILREQEAVLTLLPEK